MKKKIIISLSAIILLLAAAGLYYVFVYTATHHRDVANEGAITVTALQLVNDYKSNETRANAKYLNKAVCVKGIIQSTGKDQAGNTTITIKSTDPFSGIFCSLKPGIKLLPGDSTVVVKGICTGLLSDVVLSGAVLVR